MKFLLLSAFIALAQSASLPVRGLNQQCGTSKDCKSGLYCFQGICQNNIGKQCMATSECDSVLQCISSRCQTPRGDLVTDYGLKGYGEICDANREGYKCKKGLYCDDSLCKVPLAQFCLDASNCGGTKQCLNGVCHTLGIKKKLNEVCTSHGECENFNCWKPNPAVNKKVCMPYNYNSARDIVDQWLKSQNYQ